jgi:hypothetical protein
MANAVTDFAIGRNVLGFLSRKGTVMGIHFVPQSKLRVKTDY